MVKRRRPAGGPGPPQASTAPLTAPQTFRPGDIHLGPSARQDVSFPRCLQRGEPAAYPALLPLDQSARGHSRPDHLGPSSPGLRQPRRRTRVRAGPGGVNGAPSFVLGLHHLADSTGTRDPGLGSRQVDEYLTFQARPKQPAWITPDHVDKEYVTSAHAAPFTGATSWKGRRVLPRPWLRPRPSNRQAAPP